MHQFQPLACKNTLSLKILTLCGCMVRRDVVGRESVGTAFPHLFHVLLQNESKAVLKWLCFWMRSHTFLAGTTSLMVRNRQNLDKGVLSQAPSYAKRR